MMITSPLVYVHGVSFFNDKLRGSWGVESHGGGHLLLTIDFVCFTSEQVIGEWKKKAKNN